MKTASAVIGGLIVAFVSGSVLGLVVGAFVDTSAPAGRESSNSILAISFFVLWGVSAFVFRRADSVRHAWARAFLWMGLSVLAAPVATMLFSIAFTARQTDALSGAGAGIGAGIATIGVSIVSFFIAAVLLVIAYALSRGGRAEPTKRCPKCAERILAAAAVCRYCGHEFDRTTVISGSSAPSAGPTQTQVPLPRGASFWRRLAAYLLDLVLVYLPIIVLWLALGAPGGAQSNALGWLYFIALALYFIASWTAGATVGMRITELRIVADDGSNPTLAQATVRLACLALVQVVLFSVIGAVVFAVFRLQGRPYWHDRASHTSVIKVGLQALSTAGPLRV